MQSIEAFKELDEKSLEIILNFKPQDKFDRRSIEEVLKLKNDIKKAVNFLSKDEQEVLVLRYFHNLSIENIASKLSVSQDEVKKRLLGGIKNIKDIIRGGFKDNLEKNQILKQPEISVKKEVKASTLTNNRRIPLFVRIVNIIFSLGFWVLIYFLVQKFFFTQLPTLNELPFLAKNFMGDQITNVQSIIHNQVKNKYIKQNKKAIPVDPYLLKISGSTSLLTLSKTWEEAFEKENPKYRVELVQSDSDKGVDSLLDGKINIANSSRPVTFSDKKKALEKGVDLIEHRVALDALAIITNSLNSTDELSLDELKEIFSGNDTSSKPIAREKGSGTNDFVINRILESSDFPSLVLRVHSNNELIEAISKDSMAIGFINSNNYPWENKKIKFLTIKTYDDSPGISPFLGKHLNEQAIRYGDYPLSHYLYIITLNEYSEGVQKFIDWVLGSEGQKIVEKSGLISVRTEE